MSSIYVVCAGTSAANGIYDPIIPGGYQNRTNSNYVLMSVGSTWELQDISPNPDSVLYVLNQVSVISNTGWSVSTGSSPAPKTYEYVAATAEFGTLLISGAGSSDVNGTYTYGSSVNVNYSTGAGQNIPAYLHSSGTYVITTFNSPNGSWNIWSRPSFGGTPYYSSNIPSGEGVPIGSFTYAFFDQGIEPAPSSALSSSISCNNTTTNASNFFIGRTNNNSRIVRGADNKFYIRGKP